MAFPAGFQFELAPYVAVRVRYFAYTLIVNRSSKGCDPVKEGLMVQTQSDHPPVVEEFSAHHQFSSFRIPPGHHRSEWWRKTTVQI